MFIIKTIIALLLVPVVVYLVLAMVLGREGALRQVLGPARREPVDFETLQLKESPNQYLVCPPRFCTAAAHAESPVFDVTVEELRDAWFRVVERQPRANKISSDPENEQYSFVARTPVLLFPDTVTVRFLALDEQRSTLAVYSRSHYGHSDLGVNKSRITDWLEQLRAEVARAGAGG